VSGISAAERRDAEQQAARSPPTAADACFLKARGGSAAEPRQQPPVCSCGLFGGPFPGGVPLSDVYTTDHPEATPARAALRSAPAHELYDLPSDICVCDHAYIFGARADRDVPELMSRTCHVRSARPTCSVVAAHPSNDFGRGKVANADSKRRGACRRVRN